MAPTYTLDRWSTTTAANQAITVSRQVTGDTTNLPFIQYCARFQRNSGQTGTTALPFAQSMETINTIPFIGKTVTVSFYARAGANFSAASSALNMALVTGTGTDQNMLSGYTGNSTAFSVVATLTTTWQRFTVTGSIASTVTEMGPDFYYTPVGTAGTNDYYEITGVQIDIGSVALPFRTYAATIQSELAACQRYLPAFTGPNSAVMGYAYQTNGSLYNIPFPVTARVAPTGLTVSGTTNAYALNTATSVTPAFSVSSINNCQVTASHTIIAGQGAQLVVGGLLLFTGCEL